MSKDAEQIVKLTELVDKQLTLIDKLPSWLEGVAVVGVLFSMILGVFWVFNTLKLREQGFGPNSLKALGIVLFIPSLVLLALLTDFQTETLAALLGTVAGYVLSNTQDNS